MTKFKFDNWPQASTKAQRATAEILMAQVDADDMKGYPELDGSWPWCKACKSYHHPQNSTCRTKTRKRNNGLVLGWSVVVLGMALGYWVGVLSSCTCW